jgi:hypothetical protein
LAASAYGHKGYDLEQYEGKIKFLAGAEDIVQNVMFINMGMLFRK